MLKLENLKTTVVDGKYRVMKLLGKGGMGAVYLAVHTGTERPVALKLIVPEYADDPAFVERFRREARAAGRMRHPNVVDVTDFGLAEIDGDRVAYLVMEYLDGCGLDEVLAEDQRLPLEWVVGVFEQVCVAIGELHRKGIVHRDLKPSNIWLEPNMRGGVTVKILDFGLAKLREQIAAPDDEAVGPDPDPSWAEADDGFSEATTLMPGAAVAAPAPAAEAAPEPDVPEPDVPANLTRPGAIMGTPAYMAPEQCSGEPVGSAADVYSLGVILYEMLAGSPPFAGRPGRLIAQHRRTAPQPLCERNPAISRSVSDVVMSALAKEPAARPATPELFASALRAKAEGPGATVRRGLVLALDHFPAFARVALPLLVPHYVLGALAIPMAAFDRGAFPGLLLALLVAESLALVLAGVFMRGVSTLVVAQIMLAPLREVRVTLAFSALKRLIWPSSKGVAVFAALVLAPAFLGVALMQTGGVALTAAGAAAFLVAWKFWCDMLQLPNAILAEGLDVGPALRRSRELARRTPVDTYVVGAVTLVVPLLPWVFDSSLRGLSTNVWSAALIFAGLGLYRLVVMAIASVLTSALYFKQRLANGEPTEPLLDRQFVTEPPPRSQWQRRLDVSLLTQRLSGSSDT